MDSPTTIINPAAWELARREFRRELLDIEQDLLALLDKAAMPEGLVDLTPWERAIIGMVLCYTTASLMLPDRPYPTLNHSIN